MRTAKGCKSYNIMRIPKYYYTTAKQINFRVCFKKFELFCQPFWEADIVLIHASDITALRKINPLIKAICKPMVYSVMDNAKPGIGKRPCYIQ